MAGQTPRCHQRQSPKFNGPVETAGDEAVVACGKCQAADRAGVAAANVQLLAVGHRVQSKCSGRIGRSELLAPR